MDTEKIITIFATGDSPLGWTEIGKISVRVFQKDFWSSNYSLRSLKVVYENQSIEIPLGTESLRGREMVLAMIVNVDRKAKLEAI